MRTSKKKSNCYKTLLVLALLVLCLSIALNIFGPKYLKGKITKSMTLTPNSERNHSWASPPVEVYRKYYFFVVNNTDEFLQGSKPVLIEKGPYVYRQTIEKRHVDFITPNTVRFKPVTTFYFEQSLSNGTEDDLITVLNIPLVSALSRTKYSESFSDLKRLIKINQDMINMFIPLTIRSFISGNENDLLTLLKEAGRIQDDRFGLLLTKNGTERTEFVIETGVENFENAGRYLEWNNKTKLDIWFSDKANEIHGKDGSFNPIMMKRSDQLNYFNAEMCRSYKMTYLRDNKVENLKVYDYHLPENMFSMSQNEGYCEGKCLGDGVFNLSRCVEGAPSFMSQPHFLNADQKFRDSVVGMNPNKDTHDFVLQFEPTAGVMVKGRARFQVNFYVEPNEDIEMMSKLSSTLLPVFWFEEDVKLNSTKLIEKLSKLSLANRVVATVSIVLISVGAVCTLFLTIVIIMQTRNTRKNKLSSKKSAATIQEKISFKQDESYHM